MLTFEFDISGAAPNNSVKANTRESTRMCCIARGLANLGHTVRIVFASQTFLNSRRWAFFEDLWGKQVGGLKVLAAERGQDCDVAIKTSVRCGNADGPSTKFKLLVAHEYDTQFDSNPQLIPVPFLVHDRLIEYMMEAGLFRAYLCDDVAVIREHFAVEKKTGRVGYRGCGWNKRKQWAKELPEYCECHFYDSHNMAAGDHCRWLMGFEAGLVLPGDTPKVNLTPLLAMLGISIVSIACPRRVVPPITDKNSILLNGWDDHEGLEEGLGRAGEIAKNATMDYKAGWSPMGQARLIADALS